MSSGDLVHLNVGGHRFSTSRHTLTVVPETFFTALLSGRIPALKVSSRKSSLWIRGGVTRLGEFPPIS
jgi:hypothetical protein